jgi:ABC-type arginine/histidine transport system permease subunit
MCVFFENVGFVLLRRVLRAADDEFVMAPRVEVLGESHKAFEVFVFVAVVYFVICFSLSQLFSALERRYARAHK